MAVTDSDIPHRLKKYPQHFNDVVENKLGTLRHKWNAAYSTRHIVDLINRGQSNKWEYKIRYTCFLDWSNMWLKPSFSVTAGLWIRISHHFRDLHNAARVDPGWSPIILIILIAAYLSRDHDFAIDAVTGTQVGMHEMTKAHGGWPRQIIEFGIFIRHQARLVSPCLEHIHYYMHFMGDDAMFHKDNGEHSSTSLLCAFLLEMLRCFIKKMGNTVQPLQSQKAVAAHLNSEWLQP